MASEEILASVGCKFSGLLVREIIFPHGCSSWSGAVAACAAGALDASQMQPAFSDGSPPKPGE